jgi:hypothetical protein
MSKTRGHAHWCITVDCSNPFKSDSVEFKNGQRDAQVGAKMVRNVEPGSH